MPSSRLSTKGQIVIPLQIREWLGLRPGDRIDFVMDDGGSVRLRPALLDVRELRGSLAEPGRRPISVEEMKEAAAGGAAGRVGAP